MTLNEDEINRLIAEKVMGWEPAHIEDDVPTGYDTEFGILYVGDQDYGDLGWNPAEDIGDAWLTLEKFEYHRIEFVAGHYFCTLANGGAFFEGDAETSSMAICNATLKAVGVEVKT